jgi:hypothetical protein
MTAYVSRLLRGADRSAGIHPRPRSRYEPDPGTYFDPGPIEVDDERQTEFGGTRDTPVELDAAAPRTPGRAREPRTDYPPQVNRPVIADPPTAAPAAPAGVAASGTPRPPNRPQNEDSRPHVPDRTDALTSLTDHQFAAPRTSHAASPVADPAAQPATPEPTAPPEGTGATIPPPLRDHEPIREMDRHADQTPLPATSFAAPRTDPVTGASRQRDAEQATKPRYSSAAMPDPTLRQRIVDAVIEPVRADPTEVVVHIDRIDVRAAASSQPPPATPRHPRAAPTSLESYLRAQSRRRSG